SDGDRLRRLEFETPLADAAELRPILKKLYR
ncbi:HugZ family protein, partial [Sinorhizobium meliloti]